MRDEQHAIIRLDVPDACQGMRLDRFIAERLTQFSRQRIKAIIQAGGVRIDTVTCLDASRKLRAGQAVELEAPPAAPALALAEEIPLDVVYEDADLIVVDKPAGLVTHPAPGHPSGTLVNALLSHAGTSLSGIGGVMRPGIVHRLDKDTSGLLVVAKTDIAHQGLAAQFAAHGADGRLQRSYAAVVWGGFDRPRGTVDAPLGRSVSNRRKIAVVGEDAGRRAVTHYAVEAQFSFDGPVVASRLRVELETGRTHQIRVHMASIAHPLLGDRVYGAGFKASASHLPPAAREALAVLDRQALHAARLGFEHPRTGEALQFESELPNDLKRLLEGLGAESPSQRSG